MAGVGIYFNRESLPPSHQAVRLGTDTGELADGVTDKWVLFDDGGALTLWVGADGLISRASATAGADLTTYQPPQSGV